MKRGSFAIAAGMLALGLATLSTPSNAQGPLYDRVNVSLPYSVTVGNRTLQPGDYVIQQLRDQGGNSRVLLIYSDNGMKFETSAMTIPTLDQNTPEDTKVVLHHLGPDYYFDKIWIQGKNYGYEFPLPDSVKSRQNERMQPISVAANYSTVPASEANNTASAATTTRTTTAGAATTQSATTHSATTSAATNRQTTSPAAQQATTNQTTAQATQPATTTQSTPAPATTTAPMTAQSTTQPSTVGNADRNADQNATTSAATSAGTSRNRMPATSAGWLMMLLGGGALSGVGTVLRRKR
jgi:hypothetical protein